MGSRSWREILICAPPRPCRLCTALGPCPESLQPQPQPLSLTCWDRARTHGLPLPPRMLPQVKAVGASYPLTHFLFFLYTLSDHLFQTTNLCGLVGPCDCLPAKANPLGLSCAPAPPPPCDALFSYLTTGLEILHEDGRASVSQIPEGPLGGRPVGVSYPGFPPSVLLTS